MIYSYVRLSVTQSVHKYEINCITSTQWNAGRLCNLKRKCAKYAASIYYFGITFTKIFIIIVLKIVNAALKIVLVWFLKNLYSKNIIFFLFRMLKRFLDSLNALKNGFVKNRTFHQIHQKPPISFIDVNSITQNGIESTGWFLNSF